jgi:phosphoribosylaminoimidazole (AIR) synthetase
MGQENPDKTPQSEDLYKQYGVASNKSDIKANFESIIDNMYPGAFVNINDDPSNPDKRTTMHADGDGSKFIQRVLDYYENGDENIFAGTVDDGLSMNTSDIAAAGFVFGRIHIVDIFDCGNANIKDIVTRQIKKRFQELIKIYKDFDFDLKFFGGETADLPYQVKSGVFNVAVSAWADKEDVIIGQTKVGDVILGLHSDGQAVWEDKPNFGGMSNGMTLLRGGAMDLVFNTKYPDLGDGHFYKGRHYPNDKPNILGGATVSEAILSPTRQWAIVIREIIQELKDRGILQMLHGISINTGGGATKIANVGQGVTYVKYMPEASPLFSFIQAETKQPWKHMYTTFNCGIGADIVGENNPDFINAVKAAVLTCGLDLSKLGSVEPSLDDKNHVVLNTPYGWFEY